MQRRDLPAQAEQQQAAPKYPAQAPQPFKQHPGDAPGDMRIWLASFDAYMRMIEMNNRGEPTPDAIKNEYLIANLGTEGLRTFLETPAFEQKDQMTHAEFREAVKIHFGTKMTRYKARYDFQHRQQEDGETIQQFETALRVLIKDCNFPENVREEMLITQLINGTTETQAQKELLAQDHVDLAAVLKHLNAHETAAKETHTFKPGRIQATGRPYPRMMRGRGASQGTTPATSTYCGSCGGSGHRPGESRCPASNQACSKCRKVGHFARVCRSAPAAIARQQQSSSRRGRGRFAPRGQRGSRRPVTIGTAEIRSVDDQGEKLMAEFWISDGKQLHPQLFQVDTGAEVSLISSDFYRQKLQGLPLRQPRRKLTAVDGRSLPVLGSITTKVQFGGRMQRGILYVLDSLRVNLLGNNFLKPLQVVIECGTRTVKAVQAVDLLRQKFPSLFQDGMGTFKGQPHRIRIDPNAVPRAVRLRPIPIARRDAAIKEVKAMDKAGIWEEVQQSEWVHPLVVVPKPDGEVRITTDLTALNQHVIPERFPLPKIADLLVNMSGSKIFSKLDLKKGYFHIPLDEQSRDLTTTITPLGLRRYCRLPMGLTDSASAFQRRVQQTLAGLEGVEVYIDDVVVHGKNQEEHDRRLHNALDRLQEADFRLQPKKLVFGAEKITALGHVITKDRISPDPKNVEAIKAASYPNNNKELQRFLGMVNYFHDFLPDIASIAEPLRQLSRGEEPFKWTQQRDLSFRTIKEMLTSATQLRIFDPEAKTIVTTDASDVGVGGMLTQIQKNKEVPIAFYSRTLDASERNYSATEREALAAIRACERWENYLLGRKFVLRTDHQALRQLLENPKSKRQSAKFQRWKERLDVFDYHVEYIAGPANQVADWLSRLQKKADQFGIQQQATEASVQAVNRTSLGRATDEDPVLSRLKELVQQRQLHLVKKEPDLVQYRRIAEQFEVSEDGCLQRQKKTLVPEKMRPEILTTVHQGHPGMTRMKSLMRLAFWWPDVDRDIERNCRTCEPCQRSSKSMPALNMPADMAFPRPQDPGLQYAIDITGPFYNGRYIVVLIDYRSRFPEILDTTDITSAKIIQWLSGIFDRNGNPQGLVSDNGPQFTSQEFVKFLQSRDIHQYLTSRYNPRENGLVERFNRCIKEAVEAFTALGTSWIKGLNDAINAYRAAPQEDDTSPGAKFFRREYRPAWCPNTAEPTRRVETKQRNRKPEPQAAKYKYTGQSLYQKGERALTRLPHVPKGRSPFSEPKFIIEVLGRYTYRLEDGSTWNAKKLKPFRVHQAPMVFNDYDDRAFKPPNEAPQVRRSTRRNKGIPPRKFSPG